MQPSDLLTLTRLCPQAAELVTENCEAYEAHMRDIRDYLEERLEVRGDRGQPCRLTCPRGRCPSVGRIAGTGHCLPVKETQSGDLGNSRSWGTQGAELGAGSELASEIPKRGPGPSRSVSFSQTHGCVGRVNVFSVSTGPSSVVHSLFP